jgi:putative DNA primase/helicase
MPRKLTADEQAEARALVAKVKRQHAQANGHASTPAKPLAAEAYNDPHLLARSYRAGVQAMYYHRQEYTRWDGSAYRILNDKEVKAEVTAVIKAAFDRENLARIADWQENGCKGKQPVAPQVTTGCVGNVTQALAGMSLLSSTVNPPAWLGSEEREWKAGEVLACRNALVHLPSLAASKEPVSIPPTPLFFSHNALDYDFDRAAPIPIEWRVFLESIWPKDPQAIATLQEWFGYCLLPDTSQHKILLMVGPKRSGKGTIARVLRALLGLHNTCSPTLASLGMNFGLQPLLDKTLAVIGDARLSGRTDAAVVVERLLSISGEDPQTIDRKHQSALTLTLPVRFVVLTNELPRLTDPSGALAGRFILLRQTESFYGREDRTLTSRLLAKLPGILLWAVEGWKRLQDRGYFVQPDSSKKVIRQMEDLSSPIGAFLRERCQIGAGFEVPRHDLFNAWQSWCADHGEKDPGSDGTFGRDLRAAVPGIDSRHPRSGSLRIRLYTGIRLGVREDGDDDEA